MYNVFSDITKEVNTMQEKQKVTTLRIEPELYKEVAVAAAKDGRSTNAQILHLLRQALESRKAS